MSEPAQSLTAYGEALGIRLYEAATSAIDGPILTVDFGSTVEGRPGHFHGGATAGLLETAGYAALRHALRADKREAVLKPINITTQYLSAGKPKPTFARGRITRLGRRNANLTVEAWQDDPARPIATAVMNILMA
ncbi:MAG: PaaI family thioesterase [Pseudomonadota bacterium]